MASLAFLGVGSMGQALLRGLLSANLYAPEDITIYSRTPERVAALCAELGVKSAPSAQAAVQNAEAILLAVKPQMVEKALEPLRDVVTSSQTLISVAAGVSAARLEACFSAPVPVVRSMPNTPALVGAAATAICPGQHASRADMERANAIFSALGFCGEIEEKQMDAVTGLSGSGPAYVFLFIEALADGGVRAGLPRDLAMRLAAQTVLGGAQMVLETGKHPGVLKDQVASPGGTTIAAIHALEKGSFRGVVMDAVWASAQRSKELG